MLEEDLVRDRNIYRPTLFEFTDVFLANSDMLAFYWAVAGGLYLPVACTYLHLSLHLPPTQHIHHSMIGTRWNNFPSCPNLPQQYHSTIVLGFFFMSAALNAVGPEVFNTPFMLCRCIYQLVVDMSHIIGKY